MQANHARPNLQELVMHKIMPCLWFDNQAEEAARFYTSVFRNSEIIDIVRFGEGMPGEPGSVMTVTFRIEDQEFMALNGGPLFKFSEAISFVVDCADQEEIDRLWSTLTAGGEEQPCGWLKDKYGLSWQLVPSALQNMLQDSDPERVRRVNEALMQMTKIDIKTLQAAYDNVPA